MKCIQTLPNWCHHSFLHSLYYGKGEQPPTIFELHNGKKAQRPQVTGTTATGTEATMQMLNKQAQRPRRCHHHAVRHERGDHERRGHAQVGTWHRRAFASRQRPRVHRFRRWCWWWDLGLAGPRDGLEPTRLGLITSIYQNTMGSNVFKSRLSVSAHYDFTIFFKHLALAKLHRGYKITDCRKASCKNCLFWKTKWFSYDFWCFPMFSYDFPKCFSYVTRQRQRDHQCSLRDHQCGCRGGNRYEKGDSKFWAIH